MQVLLRKLQTGNQHTCTPLLKRLTSIKGFRLYVLFNIANAIITESALSFLGLGFPPDFPTWGRLLYDGANFIQITPSRAIWPGLFIALTVLSVNYIGDGLRDALDPRLRGR